jgi:hypothetical protein
MLAADFLVNGGGYRGIGFGKGEVQTVGHKQ